MAHSCFSPYTIPYINIPSRKDSGMNIVLHFERNSQLSTRRTPFLAFHVRIKNVSKHYETTEIRRNGKDAGIAGIPAKRQEDRNLPDRNN